MAGLRSMWLDGFAWLLPPVVCIAVGLWLSIMAVGAVQALLHAGHEYLPQWTVLVAALWVPWWAGQRWRPKVSGRP